VNVAERRADLAGPEIRPELGQAPEVRIGPPLGDLPARKDRQQVVGVGISERQTQVEGELALGPVS